jgi:uncharacterized membrane protein YidH (DUF202 family)
VGDHRTLESEHRNLLAQERTLLAWWRSGLPWRSPCRAIATGGFRPIDRWAMWTLTSLMIALAALALSAESV